MAKEPRLIPFSEIERKWMKNPEFARIRKEREPYFKIVKLLVKERIRQNKTQADVARKAGLQQEAISSLESMKREPQLSTLLKVVKALKLTLKIS